MSYRLECDKSELLTDLGVVGRHGRFVSIPSPQALTFPKDHPYDDDDNLEHYNIAIHLHSVTVHEADQLPLWANREGGIDLEPARHRSFADLRKRRDTLFGCWSLRGVGVDAANVALAGFFFDSNVKGLIQCFYCGLGLRADNLQEGDNIWEEHVNQNPHCPYVVSVLGPEDFNRVLNKVGRQQKDPGQFQSSVDNGFAVTFSKTCPL